MVSVGIRLISLVGFDTSEEVRVGVTRWDINGINQSRKQVIACMIGMDDMEEREKSAKEGKKQACSESREADVG